MQFLPWSISAKGAYNASCSTMAQADSNHANDKATKTIQAGFFKVLFAYTSYGDLAPLPRLAAAAAAADTGTLLMVDDAHGNPQQDITDQRGHAEPLH